MVVVVWGFVVVTMYCDGVTRASARARKGVLEAASGFLLLQVAKRRGGEAESMNADKTRYERLLWRG